MQNYFHDLMRQTIALTLLHCSPEYDYVLKKQANPVEYDKVEDVAQALTNGSVSIALLDVRVASHHGEDL